MASRSVEGWIHGWLAYTGTHARTEGGYGGGEGGGGEERRRGPSAGPGGVREAPWAHRVYMGNLPFDIEAEDIAAFFRDKVISAAAPFFLVVEMILSQPVGVV